MTGKERPRALHSRNFRWPLDHESEIGFAVPQETQYAVRLESDVPVVVQYGRLDSRQSNLAYYTTMGHRT
jgi:hypothetical protein